MENDNSQFNFFGSDTMYNIEQRNKEKIEEFKERLKPFEQIITLVDAKKLMSKIMPSKDGLTKFNVGNAECTIINNDDLVRISLNTPTEFISYNFM